MRGVIKAASAILAGVAVFLLATLPPAMRLLPTSDAPAELRERTVAGAYHVHSNRSDGAASASEIAAAAARAGLKFVILTDHGDGTARTDPASYAHGVLLIPAVEISTNGGHYVALGMPTAPYPLGGEASAVVEDVRRLGGFGVVAHPDHPRHGLAWSDWSVAMDGLEWLNADAEWRNEPGWKIGRLLFDYLVRPAPALASVFDRPTRTLAKWDSLAKTRDVVALAAADAHGSRWLGREDEGRRIVPGPGYEASFRSLSNRVVLDQPPTGDASADAARVLAAIRSGHVYSVVDAVAHDIVLRGDAASGFAPASSLPSGAELQSVRQGSRSRLEIHLTGAPGTPPVPWVLTNWSGPRESGEDASVRSHAPATDRLTLASDWRIEHDATSSGSLGSEADATTVRFTLGGPPKGDQFVALAADLPAGAPISVLTFRGSADRPMRVSVQLRFPPADARWVQSVYLDRGLREVSFDTTGMRSASGEAGPPPQSAPRSLLFVADLVNARPGDSAAFTIRDLRARR